MSLFECANEFLDHREFYSIYSIDHIGELPIKKMINPPKIPGVRFFNYQTHSYIIDSFDLPRFIGYTITDSQILYIVSEPFVSRIYRYAQTCRLIIVSTGNNAYLCVSSAVTHPSFSKDVLQESPERDEKGRFITNKGLETKAAR